MTVPKKLADYTDYLADPSVRSSLTLTEVITFEAIKFFSEKKIINVQMSTDYEATDLADPEQFASELHHLEKNLERCLSEKQPASMIAIQACEFLLGGDYTGFVGGYHHEFEKTNHALQVIRDLTGHLQNILKEYSY